MSSEVQHQQQEHRFVIAAGTNQAELVYLLEGETMAVVHTAVPPALQYHGLGATLAEAALHYAAENRLRIDPQCPFMARYMAEHPEHTHLLTATKPTN